MTGVSCKMWRVDEVSQRKSEQVEREADLRTLGGAQISQCWIVNERLRRGKKSQLSSKSCVVCLMSYNSPTSWACLLYVSTEKNKVFSPSWKFALAHDDSLFYTGCCLVLRLFPGSREEKHGAVTHFLLVGMSYLRMEMRMKTGPCRMVS